MFGDAPRSTSNPTVTGCGVFGWAALAARGRFTGVEGAQSLGLMGLALPVQQLVQDLRKTRQHMRRGEEGLGWRMDGGGREQRAAARVIHAAKKRLCMDARGT